ncbi:hypothetical protein F442_21355 [Phytophthora nicotianae P10297]|uniref:Uncharacterized protein n=1 Tax=Phytophthora nicotianae P10297 TaxID=1317064 RepID=W2Y5P2_PHYNI|nr:hypothetical protein F442_21355 [Phytophthora nicotianae P10297]
MAPSIQVVIDLATATFPYTARPWNEHKVLLLVWRVHTAIIFHATWRIRNDILFREAGIKVPSIPGMMCSLKKHCRFIYQHAT